jgi:hypothetical protein
MQLRIHTLRPSADPSTALRRDGWQVQPAPNGSLCASHPLAPDQRTARIRLDSLGLLTSSALHIEFLLHRTPATAD